MPNDLIIGNIRCQQLGDDILRIEVKTPNGFLDENTFFVPSRNEIEVKQNRRLTKSLCASHNYPTIIHIPN